MHPTRNKDLNKDLKMDTICENCRGKGKPLVLSNGDQLLCPSCYAKHKASDKAAAERRQQNDSTGAADETSIKSRQQPCLTSNRRTFLQTILEADEATIPKSFCDSLDRIFQHSHQDIHDSLMNLELDTLTCIQKCLLERVGTQFPQYKNKRARNRQVKHTAVPDIIHLGMSVVNNQPTRELDKVLIDDGANQETQQDAVPICVSELSELLRTIITLKDRVSAIERDVRSLKDENVNLKDQLESRVCSCASNDSQQNDDTANIDAPSTSATPSVVTDEGNLISQEQQPPRQPSERLSHQETSQEARSSDECTESDSDETNGSFQFPSKYLRRLRKLEKRVSQQSRPTEPPPQAQDTRARTYLRAASRDPQAQDTRARTYLRAASRDQEEQLCHVYVGNTHHGATSSDILAQLTGMGIPAIQCKVELLTRSQNAKWRSFKVSTRSTHRDTLLHTGNWPVDIVIRPFRAIQGNKPPNQPSRRSANGRHWGSNLSQRGESDYGYQSHAATTQRRSSYHGGPNYRARAWDGRDTTSYRDERHY